MNLLEASHKKNEFPTSPLIHTLTHAREFLVENKSNKGLGKGNLFCDFSVFRQVISYVTSEIALIKFHLKPFFYYFTYFITFNEILKNYFL